MFSWPMLIIYLQKVLLLVMSVQQRTSRPLKAVTALCAIYKGLRFRCSPATSLDVQNRTTSMLDRFQASTLSGRGEPTKQVTRIRLSFVIRTLKLTNVTSSAKAQGLCVCHLKRASKYYRSCRCAIVPLSCEEGVVKDSTAVATVPQMMHRAWLPGLLE